jgi:CIC family chloride channel protein
LIDTFIIGIIGAVCAEIFIFLLHLITSYTFYFQKINPLFIVVVITIGGLISGFLVYTFAPEAEGHGTDAVIRAFHRNGGYLRPIVVPVKIIASAITIGTGGAAGKEGPTALFSAGVGSAYANFRKVGIKKRQIFVLIGMASGLSAVFKAPLGTSIFAIEVLYTNTEFETRELIYVLFGPFVAYTITGFLFGWEPIFHIPVEEVTSLKVYFDVFVLGVLSGVLGFVLPNVFYYTRDFFRKIPILPHFKPAIGAFLAGIIAIFFPQVLGGGYHYIEESINGELIGWILLALLVAKMFAFSFTIGSGGSGGVFAPSLFIGAMFGGFMAYILHAPYSVLGVIGMASVFGAAARTPLSTIVMVAEMTGGYTLLAPTTLGVLSAFFVHDMMVKTFKPKYVSLYEAQLLSKEYSPIYQVEKIREILMCHSKMLKLEKAVLDREDLLDLIEKGEEVEIRNNKYIFFGTFTKKVTLDEGKYFKKYKDVDVVYVFRNGKWLPGFVVNSILPGDEVLLVGSKEAIDKIKNEFIPISQTFSKLRVQEENIEGGI